jgi:hypothetical protein
MSVNFYQTTQSNIPDNSHLLAYCYENLTFPLPPKKNTTEMCRTLKEHTLEAYKEQLFQNFIHRYTDSFTVT